MEPLYPAFSRSSFIFAAAAALLAAEASSSAFALAFFSSGVSSFSPDPS